MNPYVSVIVPVYKVEKYLHRCVDSLVGQTLDRIEIILVDDGSPDGCPAICDWYVQKDSRVRVIHKENAGLGYARNSGLALATGTYISFVDSDDYVEPHMMEEMYRAAAAYQADFVRADHYRETESGQILNRNDASPVRKGFYGEDELRKYLLYPQLGLLPWEDGKRYVSCSVWRNIYKRSVIEESGLCFCSERDLISEDLIFNLSFMMKAQRAYVINEKLYHYTVNNQSLTQAFRPDRFEQELKLYHALEQKLEKEGILDVCRIRLQRHLLIRARKCIKGQLYQPVSWNQKKRGILEILCSREIKEIFHSYPIRQLPLKYRVTALVMKWRSLILLRLIQSKL